MDEHPTEIIQARELKNYELQFEILNKKLEQIESVMTNLEDRDNNLYRVYFGANPIPENQRRAGFGGINRYKALEGYNNSDLIINTSKRLDILKKQLAIQSISLDEIELLAKRKEELLASIPSIQPIRNQDLKRMASGYSYRTDPFTKKEECTGVWIFPLNRETHLCFGRWRCGTSRQPLLWLRKTHTHQPRFWLCKFICTFK